MKITFLVMTSDNKMHLLQHDTLHIDRPKWQSSRKINVELEWERFQARRPDVVERVVPNNPEIDWTHDTPILVGALQAMHQSEGQVVWFEGVETEPHRERDV